MKRHDTERGAAAVEFAFVAVLLVILLLGVLEGGRLFFLQANLSFAAREAAREIALRETPDPQTRLDDAFSWGASLGPWTPCPEGSTTAEARVEATFTTEVFLPVGPDEITLTGTGVMRCGG